MGYIFDAMRRSDRKSDVTDAETKGAPIGPPAQEVDPTVEDDAPILSRITPSDDPGADEVEGLTESAVAADSPDADSVDASESSDAEEVDDRIITITQPAGIIAEEYRSIRTSILARWEQKRHLIHTITSATPQEGKTIRSLNLGVSFAELRNRRTVVVEADLRLPQFANLLALDPTPGLVTLLEGKAALEEVVCELPNTTLQVIPAGRRANDRAVQLLSSTHAISLIEQLKREYDHVVIDTPPVVELADAGILGAMSDDVFLIGRIGRTPRDLIEQAIRTLGSYNAEVSGLIATDQKPNRKKYYYKYGYRYRYGYYHGPAS